VWSRSEYRGGVAVLVIDDDQELCALLAKVFDKVGLQASFVHTGDAGLDAALSGRFDLAILDVMLPALDGFEVLRRLRKQSELPVIMLTARGDDVDRIVGLEIGADDYLPKPFHPRELIARVKAILRRSQRTGLGPERPLEANGVRLEPGARSVSCDGQPVDLTTTEFDILQMLIEAAGRVLSRDVLLERLDGRESTAFDRSIDMHISHLRKKLGTGTQRIRTVRGVGYQFMLPSAQP